MKVCLINPKGPQGTMRSIPHGLMQIQACLEDAGHVAEIWDYNIGSDITFDETELKQFDVIGLSSMSTQLPHSAKLTKFIPEGIPVIWGGIHPTLDPESILNKFPSHIVVRGEGEIPMLKILEFLEGKRDTDWLEQQPGICLNRDSKLIINLMYFHKNINELPDVDYTRLPHFELYLTHWNPWFEVTDKYLPVLVSRGCFWDCNFCINALFRKQGGHYRSKSIEKIRRETSAIIDKYKIKHVEPRAEDLFGDRKLLSAWKEYAKEKNLLWCANARFNYFNKKMYSPADLKELMDSGLYNIGMAVEAGCEKIRNEILNKKVKDADIQSAIQTLNETRKRTLSIGSSFVTHFPGDTLENRIKIIKLMQTLATKTNILFSGPQIYRPYPGSKLFEMEPNRVTGDFDYYLLQFDEQGTPKQRARSLEGYFWGTMLMIYFNKYYRLQKIQNAPGEKTTWSNSDQSRNSYPLLSMVMLPVKLRLKYDYWGFFADQYVLPATYLGIRFLILQPFWPAIRKHLAKISILKKIKRRLAPNL
jgi:radical SAM superfamily enzyme YgiQ (UPF0313 family)